MEEYLKLQFEKEKIYPSNYPFILSLMFRLAQNFIVTYKLGQGAYERVLDVLEKTYKVIFFN
jgi:hypothetical protein